MKNSFLPVLMYHKISKNKIKDNYTVSAENFEKQMQYLFENGFKTVLPEDIPTLKDNNKKPVMITFDDGYESDYTLAYPILDNFSFKSTHFITTNFIDGFMQKDRCMSWKQLKDLKKHGFSIQSHTHTHPLFNKSKIKEELSVSKNLLEERLNSKIFALALPGGIFFKGTLKIAKEEGYKYIFGSRPGINAIDNAQIDLFNRVIILSDVSLDDFKRIVEIDRKIYYQMMLGYCAKRTFKRIFGYQRYYRLWRKYFK